MEDFILKINKFIEYDLKTTDKKPKLQLCKNNYKI